jgi:hypothetical protein
MIASFRSAETLDIPGRSKAMRKALIIALVVLAASIARSVGMDACGDKFLQVGRGAKFRAYAAIYPASILIYSRGAPGASTAIRERGLQASLMAAGHTLTMVEDEQLLEQALKSDKFDLVLADVGDATSLERKVQSSPTRPTVLPVMYKPTKAEAEALEKQLNCRLKASDRSDRYLTIIDDAMKARAKDGRGRQKKQG